MPDSWSRRLGKALGKDGLDLERRASNAGKHVDAGWKWLSTKAKALSSVTTHEERLRKVEADTTELAKDVRDVKAWIKDIDNRTTLLEHFNNYDLGELLCPQCNAGMRVKRNRNDGTFFFGCSKYGSTRCKGTRPISDPYVEILAKKYFAA